MPPRPSPASRPARVVTFIPYALADWDDYADRAIAALGSFGIEAVSAHRSSAPDRAILEAEVVMMGGGNTFRLLDSLYRLGVIDGLGAPRARGRDPLRGRLRRHQRRLPDHPHHQRHADLPPAELRRARAGAVPDQPPLHRRRPGLDLHGRDARRAHRRVPRGERLRRAGAVRGLVAARQRRVRRGHRPRRACSSARTSARSTRASTSPGSSQLTPRFDGGRRPEPGGSS